MNFPDHEVIAQDFRRRFDELEKAEGFVSKLRAGIVDESLCIKPIVALRGSPVSNPQYTKAKYEIVMARHRQHKDQVLMVIVNIRDAPTPSLVLPPTLE